jgi:hypothetical protein
MKWNAKARGFLPDSLGLNPAFDLDRHLDNVDAMT